MLMLLHLFPSQKPKTPKVKSLKFPNGTAVITGVDKTDSRSKPNAANSTTDRGVDGRNMMALTYEGRQSLFRHSVMMDGVESAQ